VDPHDPDGQPVPPPGAPPGGGWAPPDAGADPGMVTSAALHVEMEHADGPPVPPPVRRRRRRRRAALIAGVLLVVGVPSGLALVSTLGDDGLPSATGDDGTDTEVGEGPADEESEGDGDTDDGDTRDRGAPLDPPDLDSLGGTDAVYGRLLVDIDASERVMMEFQDGVATAFSVPVESPDALVEALRELGEAGRDELLEVRGRLDDPVEVDGAEAIRERYVAHLDSWADYMDAVAADPGVLGGEGAGAGYTVVINATADAFARSLEEELPDSADASVRAYADDILDRGFRGSGDSQV
jgi:hypothetical protein